MVSWVPTGIVSRRPDGRSAAAAQGVDLRAPHITSPKLQAVMQRIRGAVPHYDIDRLFAPDIEAIKAAVQNAEIAAHSPLRFASQEA